ncbi:endolytic transglycosylase MltG [Paenibacillus pinihumi]|uniref:endolytic transglycosylase MltG n=1 Tax=Paenibacillus pinihumi TaxID=669462 RepID=UPI001FE0CFCB|nr:endolytic transglycosylase MltG [Paenibacillus pinihumi]
MDTPIRRGRITLWVIITLLGLILLAAAGAAGYVWNGLRPAAAGDTKLVTIPKGSSPFKVAEVLEKEGIIRNAFLFKYYLRYKNEGSQFQAGSYELAPGMEPESIIAKLNSGDTAKEETVQFTIPEGYTVLQIADKLSAEGLVDKQQFLELAESKEMMSYSAEAALIEPMPDMHHLLEGYMFPETYEMKKGSTAKEIMIRMLQEMDRKLAKLPEEWDTVLEQRKLNFHQMLTIASLIEREVVNDDERPIVAGVIYNRLKQGMKLQIDATVQYMLDKPKERLLIKDTEIKGPYNTYLISGLPPGPISSPSLASIEAALYPQENDYLYYVTKKDGTSAHYFGKTYNEHLKNKKKSEANEKNGGKSVDG